MITLSVKITMYAPFCHSLKDKRMIVQSIVSKIKNKFNVSVAEVAMQDVHQTVVIGVAVVSGSISHCQNVLDEVVRFIENNTESDITDIEFI